MGLALLVNSEQPLQMAIGAGRFMQQTIYTVKPRYDGAEVERTHEAIGLYEWARITVVTHGAGTSYSYPIHLASEKGIFDEHLAEFRFCGEETGIFYAAD